jgi:hypothetical protein
MRTRRFTIWMLIAALLLPIGAMSSSIAQAQSKEPFARGLAVPISGTVNGVPGTLDGTFSVTRFAAQNGQILAVGVLTATVSDATGAVLQTIVAPLAMPVQVSSASAAGAAVIAQATCPILHLELGPLDLDLLGLVIHLDRVVLDITAESAPGNLLGNLLCAIAGLLDPPGPLSTIVNLLNQILDALGNL